MYNWWWLATHIENPGLRGESFVMGKFPLALLACSASAFAGTIDVNQWYGFGWSGFSFPIGTYGQLTPSVDKAVLDPGASPWTSTLALPVMLIVVDGSLPGDQFQVYDNGVPLGLTSSVAMGPGESCAGGDGPVHCLLDPLYSSGIWLLMPGSHSITISTVGGYTLGGAWFGVGTGQGLLAIPEPSTSVLVSLGGLGLLAWRRGWWTSRFLHR